MTLPARLVPRRDFANAALVFLLLLCWTALLRLPFWRHTGEDEIFFAVVGRQWLHGALPYAASFDVKPPGLFALFALTQFWSAAPILPIKLLGCVAVAATSTGLFLIGRRYFSPQVGLYTALLYPFCSLFLSGTELWPEILQAPFETFAVLLLLAPRDDLPQRNIVLAGLLLGAAATIRQPGVFEAALLGLMVFFAGSARKYLRFASFLAGAAIVPAGFLVYFWASGDMREFLNAAVLGAVARMHGDNISFAAGAWRFFPMQKPIIGLLLLTLLLGVHRDLVRQAGLARPVVIIATWLSGVALGLIAAKSQYDHYFLILIPPMLLLGAVFIFHAGGKLVAWAGNLAPLLFATFVMVPPLVYVAFNPSAPGADLAVERQVARRLHDAGLADGGRILVLDSGAPIYLYAHAVPAFRVFHRQHLLCDFPGVGADPLAEALASAPQFIVIKQASARLICELPGRIGELNQTLHDRYARIGSVTGPTEGFGLYQARPTSIPR
jgi:hypothetical protein